jgi:hypothetical protein
MSCLLDSRASLTFCEHSNAVASGANVIFSFFDDSLNEANVVETPGSGFSPSGEGFFPFVGLRPSRECDRGGGEDKEWNSGDIILNSIDGQSAAFSIRSIITVLTK